MPVQSGVDAAGLEAVSQAFKRFDRNGDGLIRRCDLSKVLKKLDTAFWTPDRLDRLFGGFDKDLVAGCNSRHHLCSRLENQDTVDYERFVLWLFQGVDAIGASCKAGRGEAIAAPGLASGSLPGGTSTPVPFKLMTFNVEEYYHGYKGTQRGSGDLKDCVFETVKGIRAILEAHSPDVLCLEEHSLGSGFTEKDIMDALIGDLGYCYVSEPTGEARAWYSGLANAVVWKGAQFELQRSWRVELTGSCETVPGTNQKYTPRAACCAELLHTESGRRLAVCATHLLGGRFEDKSFVAEALAGRNMRSEQARKIVQSIQAICGEEIPSIIAGDFNVMRDGLMEGSAFCEGAESYFRGKLLDGALSMAAKLEPNQEDYTFSGFYVPFQVEVHKTLREELGYCVAYGRSDGDSEMKTNSYSGCIDWVYIRKLGSLKDETVISAIEEGLSDHNAVMVTLQIE